MLRKGFVCIDEAHIIDGEGCQRYIDILAFDTRSNLCLLIDPTIRYEINGDIDAEVQREKRNIFTSCYPQYGPRSFEVVGFWFGSRGGIGESVTNFFSRFNIDVYY